MAHSTPGPTQGNDSIDRLFKVIFKLTAVVGVSQALNFTSEPQPGGLIFTLPAEIRNVIYELALTEEDKVVRVDTSYKQAPLTRTCHAIRNEALSVFYQANDFFIPIKSWRVMPNTYRWFQRLGKRGRGHVKEVIMVVLREYGFNPPGTPAEEEYGRVFRALWYAKRPDMRVLEGNYHCVLGLENVDIN